MTTFPHFSGNRSPEGMIFSDLICNFIQIFRFCSILQYCSIFRQDEEKHVFDIDFDTGVFHSQSRLYKVTVQGKVWADRIGWDKNYMMSLDADRLLASPSESQRKSVQLSFSCIYIAYSYLVRHKTAINVANFATKMLN